MLVDGLASRFGLCVCACIRGIVSGRVCGICIDILSTELGWVTTIANPSFAEIAPQNEAGNIQKNGSSNFASRNFPWSLRHCNWKKKSYRRLQLKDLFAVVLKCSYSMASEWSVTEAWLSFTDLFIFLSSHRSAAAWYWEKPVHWPNEPVQILQSKTCPMPDSVKEDTLNKCFN